MNHNIQQVAYRIDDNVSLSTIYPLEGIISTLFASFGCLETLGAYHPGCWVFIGG